MPFVFDVHFGLDSLPTEPGIILIRGARQFGKSTWLERELKTTIETFGPGSAFYLNGDGILDRQSFLSDIRSLITSFSSKTPVRRLFIDEITSIENWQKGLKLLRDAGELRSVLVVTTGSKASDLRHGAERLPGRKGRLNRTEYLFTPISFKEFDRHCGQTLGEHLLAAYILSGGSPSACAELGARGRIPEYIATMTRDWIYGECSRSGRDRASLLHVLSAMLRYGGTPVGQAKLAREAGLANNTVANGYVELLADLLCVGRAHQWDPSRNIRSPRKPCKYHFINTLGAVSCGPAHMRTPADFYAQPPEVQGRWYEWIVAQELWRRAALRGEEFPENMLFWQSKQHELDFVVSRDEFIEVKRGNTSPIEFSWFHSSFPKARLTVISPAKFQTDYVTSMPLKRFLMGDSPP